ncbi:hypothetical protein O3M35_010527 [Rhynocoris fuscipes]|uniref:Ankyrin repeat protein n=1 Tax=Rhynocoris fuscipes TaxID=488301 RepID=A0AAW1D4P0_9HEMI
MYAASLGISKYVNLLLKNGANPNVHDRLTTPLICLCNSTSFDDVELLKCFNLLIKAGASINICDENKMTPLMYAANRGRIQLVARMIELGSDLEIYDDYGWTAIFFAVDSGDVNMVQMLKDAGSNISLTDKKGRTLYDLATVKNYNVIAEIVNTENKSFLNELNLIKKEKMSKYDILMYDMPDYKKSDFNGFTEDALKTIMAAGLTNLVNLFIEKKIGYCQFLIFKDEDWKKIGVNISFDRKKLITYSNRIIQKKWSQDAFIKQWNDEFSLFKLIQLVSNAIRIVHILIATYRICFREYNNTMLGNYKIKAIIKNCLQDLNLLKKLIKIIYSHVKDLDNYPPADFIAPKCK